MYTHKIYGGELPMAIIDTIKAKARARVMHIVLPEGEEDRIIKAAD